MSVHSQRLERWLGAEQVAHISNKMRGYHGPPIPVGLVPGAVWAGGDGEFYGRLTAGGFAGLADRTEQALTRAARRVARGSHTRLTTGFASLSDLISEATTGGKRQDFFFMKAGVTGVATVANNLFDVGTYPPAGTIVSDATGTSPTNATSGAIPYTNPGGGDTLHFVSASVQGSVAANCLMMYDLFYQFIHNIATDPQAVSDVPTRYQSTAAKGAFITVFVTTALGSGTPSYTITYMDQDGNTAEAAASQNIVGSAIARRFPFSAAVGGGWFIPLNSGDTGVRKITNLDLSAASTGKVQVQLCKPYVLLPCVIANTIVFIDGINSAFNLVQITDSSALFFLEWPKPASTATNYNGQLIFVSG